MVHLALAAKLMALYGAKPIMILVPKPLMTQWQDELWNLLEMPLARWNGRQWIDEQGVAYLPEESKVIYESKDGRREKVFEALEWLAAMGSHVPDKGEQMVR